MKRSHLFAFGSNPFGKTCPETTDIVVRCPVDILPKLLEGTNDTIDYAEVVHGTWDTTLIRLREKTSGAYHYWSLGFHGDDPESSSARSFAADQVEDLLGLGPVRKALDEITPCDMLDITVLESGSVISVGCAPEGPAHPTPVCVYAETFDDLQTDPKSCRHALPGPPETAYQVATGLSHAILLSKSPTPGFNQVLGLGDNRHRAAMPRSEDVKQPPNHLSAPRPIDHLCGISISGVSAGGSRSAAWSRAGEGWIWGKGIEGFEAVNLPAVRDGEDEDTERGDSHIAQIAIGDGYEFVLTQNGLVWARGKSAHSP